MKTRIHRYDLNERNKLRRISSEVFGLSNEKNRVASNQDGEDR